MKLRLTGNSIRLRVTRSELAHLLAGGRVMESVRLVPGPAGVLRYVLAVDSETQAAAVSFAGGEIQVRLSPEQLSRWSEEAQVGVYAAVKTDETTMLNIVIEKDFACLDGCDEDQADTFTNPSAGAVC